MTRTRRLEVRHGESVLGRSDGGSDWEQDPDQEQEGLQIAGGEGVALAKVAGLVAFAKPANALLGGAVGE